MKKKPVIKPDDWYFLECPKDQFAACCYYEYARHCPAIIEAARSLDDNARSFLGIYPSVRYVAALASGFPNIPWLSLDARERKRLLMRFLEEEKRWNLVIERPQRIAGLPLPFPDRGTCLYESDGQTVAAIRVPWERGNNDLLAAFQRLLDKYRPTGIKHPLGRKGSYQDYLNALGAERLLQDCRSRGERSAAGAAMRIIMAYADPQKGKKRAAPYSGQSPLVLAARKVEGVLRTLYHFEDEVAFKPGGQYPLHYWMPELHVDPTD